MPRPIADDDTLIAPDHGRIAAVQSLIALGQSQIAATLARGANLDTQALGLIGLDLGLIAVVVAAQALLWTPLLGSDPRSGRLDRDRGRRTGRQAL